MVIVGSVTLLFGAQAYREYQREYDIEYEKVRALMAGPNPPDLYPCSDDVIASSGGGDIDCSLELPKFNPNPVILWGIGIGIALVVLGGIFTIYSRTTKLQVQPRFSTAGAPIK